MPSTASVPTKARRAKWLCAALMVAGCTLPLAAAADDETPRRATFEREQASHTARQVADWIIDSDNNGGLPFVIVDKVDAKVFVFYADGRLRGASPALLGLALGDDAVAGIGDKALADIHPAERTTPAGRFVASLGDSLRGEDVLWVDYDGAVSMHRVVTSKAADRRLQRLATPSPLDNRISYGCINLPKAFYEDVVRPAFAGTSGIVYVLPETRSAKAQFASYEVTGPATLAGAGPSRR